ncbi:hypothetical protein ACWGE1_19820 [Streptomyces sp. NPDC054932]
MDTSQPAPQARAVAEALRKYGAIVADNGSARYISGEECPRWGNSQLDLLKGYKGYKGSDSEAVGASGLRSRHQPVIPCTGPAPGRT